MIVLQRTGTIVCRLHDAYCRRTGYRYDWEYLEESPGFDCQPLDGDKIELWRDAIKDELQSNNIQRINSVFIKELCWLKGLYLDFAVGRLQCSVDIQRQAALWMMEVDKIADSFLIKFVMERESEN